MHEQSRSASPILWALAAVSFVLNIVVIGVLMILFMYGRQAAADLADQLGAFSNQTINYSFHITQTVPIRTNVPFSYTTVMPFSQSLPISTTVNVSKEIPVVGLITFDVPIRADVPVSLSIPIQISHTIDVNVAVPLNLNIPLQIPLQDTPLKATLDGIVKTLNMLAGR
ncbi:MAG TPA: hypothetical protein VGK81_02595 [Anaerolineae bacterium]|jgi:hypothetical protein